jgi:8-oxo-dGTP diphosphatase
MISRFNVRVYFFLEDFSGQHVLVSDEIIRGKSFTKFPGGGLEFGEGIVDCAKREAIEELGQEIEIFRHLYTTDFFIQSVFSDQDQVISVYYLARLKEGQKFRTTLKRFDFSQTLENEESFRWVPKNELMKESWTFPADKEALLVHLCEEKSAKNISHD